MEIEIRVDARGLFSLAARKIGTMAGDLFILGYMHDGINVTRNKFGDVAYVVPVLPASVGSFQPDSRTSQAFFLRLVKNL